MATVTITPSYNWVSGEVVTPAKMNLSAAPTASLSNIVNADISASAAIVGTKVAPNFGSQDVVTSGTVGPASNSTSQFVGARSSTDATPADLIFEKSRGTLTSKTVVAASDVLGRVRMFGYDGSTMVEGASIQAIIDGAPGAGDMPTRLSFRTTENGASSTTERMRIDSDGNVGIANASPTEKLDVTGNIKVSGTAEFDGQVRVPFGTSGAPGLAFDGDSDTGIIRPGSNELSFVAGGEQVMRINTNNSVGIGVTNIDTSCLLQLASTTKGFRPPIMSTSQRNDISSPATGLIVYNTTTDKINFYNGTSWQTVTSS